MAASRRYVAFAVGKSHAGIESLARAPVKGDLRSPFQGFEAPLGVDTKQGESLYDQVGI